MQKAIKEQNGDCSFTTEQEYNSVDDAVKDLNPVTELKHFMSKETAEEKQYHKKENEVKEAPEWQ